MFASSSVTEVPLADLDQQPWRRDRQGLGAFAILAAALVALSVVRWRNHWAGALDLALFDQGVWLLSELRAPELTVLPENLFGDHFSPVLLLFAPLYMIHPSPGWLLVIQAVVIATTVLPMRQLARNLGVDPTWATVAVMFSSPILMMNLYDFHPVALTAPLVAWALVAVLRDDAPTALWLTIAVGLIRADSAILMLGVAVVAGRRSRRVIVPVALTWMAIGIAVPALLHSEQTFERYYSSLGTDPIDAVTHPWRIVTTLLGEQSLRTMVMWMVPTTFLPLLRPRWFLAVVVGGLPVLLSSTASTSLPWFHHAGTVAPLVIGAALAGIARASTWRPFEPTSEPGEDAVRGPAPGRLSGEQVAAALLIGGVVVALFTSGPLTPDGPTSQTIAALTPRVVEGLDEALASIRPDDRVAAEAWLVVELAHRPVVHPFWCSAEPQACEIPGRPGSDLDVVVALESLTDRLEHGGWIVESFPGGDIIVARPSEQR